MPNPSEIARQEEEAAEDAAALPLPGSSAWVSFHHALDVASRLMAPERHRFHVVNCDGEDDFGDHYFGHCPVVGETISFSYAGLKGIEAAVVEVVHREYRLSDGALTGGDVELRVDLSKEDFKFGGSGE